MALFTDQPLLELQKTNQSGILRHNEQGNLFFGQGQYEQALSSYNSAIDQIILIKQQQDTLDNVRLWGELMSRRAAVYLRLERPMLAMLDCNAILQHNPLHVNALHRRATALESLHSYKSALLDLQALLHLETDKQKLQKLQFKIALVSDKCDQKSGEDVTALRDAATKYATSTKNSGSSETKRNTGVEVGTDATTSARAAMPATTASNKEFNNKERDDGDDDDDDDNDNDDDDDDDDDNGLTSKPQDVQLGFVEDLQGKEEEPYPLLHLDKNWTQWDGGKVGGYPIWLDPIALPTSAALQCSVCLQKMNLLMQIYAPIDEKGVVGGGGDGGGSGGGSGSGGSGQNGENDDSSRNSIDAMNKRAFHRSLYVFCCRNGKCLEAGANGEANGGSSGLCVLRCQMGQQNQFYEENPRENDEQEESSPSPPPPEHPTRDTKELVHGKPFVEYDVVTESEQYNKEQSDAAIMASVNHVSSLNVKEGTMTSQDAKKVMNTLATNADGTSNRLIQNVDANMLKFHTVTSIASDQILRYSRWDACGPLWVSNKNTLDTSAVPKCELCGEERKFEFQIMPQLLNTLKPHEIGGVGEIDWGTLVVYTCSKSCSMKSNASGSGSSNCNYRKEYIYRQPM
jgi:pre-rRNA-processing protein TSR4